jgi:UDP-N-acetylglucosamine 2-epimerase (non-hydrolysing)
VLVHGDTTTTLAASLAAYYQKIPVGHVEAGLRTFDMSSPWPEEGNRQLTGRIANMHFAPTETSAVNLRAENIPASRIFVTGNSVIDALLIAQKEIETRAELGSELAKKFSASGIDDRSRKTILVTAHRRENFGEGIRQICAAIKILASEEKVRVLFPVHPNPNIRDVVNETLRNQPNVSLLEPLDYLEFVYLLGKCDLALTDSGGVQEEAPSLGKPVLVLCETTERPEAVTAGTVRLVGAKQDSILTAVRLLLNDSKEYQRMSQAHNPYGDGKTSQRIADILAKELLEEIR